MFIRPVSISAWEWCQILAAMACVCLMPMLFGIGGFVLATAAVLAGLYGPKRSSF
jgi:hypothetical protein